MPRRFADTTLARVIAPAGLSGAAWLEAPLLVVLSIVVASLFQPDDPLLFQGGIRWTIVVALVVALRYGSLAGSLSILTLVVAWLACKRAGLYPGMDFPEMTFLGGLIIILITGEFADIWQVRLQRSESRAVYAVERLRSLTQRYALLRLSHDRLEENLLMRPYTVRDALLRLRDLSLEQSREESMPAGDELLNLLAEYCQLQRGALYGIKDGVVDSKPAARLGENQDLDRDDRLLRFALDNGVLSHLQMSDLDDTYSGPYWVCAPVSNSAGQMIGVVTVERMPFLSMNHEVLQLFAVLLNFYADVVQHGPDVDRLCQHWPSMEPVFARELVALAGMAAQRRVDTTLLLMTADDSQQASQILESLSRDRRNLDGVWWLDDTQSRVMLLMPMTGQSGFESFMLRTEDWLQEEFAFHSLRQSGVHYAHAILDGKPVEEQLRKLIEVLDHV